MMNKRKAKAVLFSVQESYVRAIKAFSKSRDYQQRGHTTKCLDEQDKAMVYIRKAEAAIDELEAMIEEVSA